jgi:hypothetical protein
MKQNKYQTFRDSTSTEGKSVLSLLMLRDKIPLPNRAYIYNKPYRFKAVPSA